MPTLRTITLGCKVNQYETQYLRQGLLLLGYTDAARGEAADLCVINTCTVTAESDRKSRKLVRQAAKSNPGAKLIVTGCYATRRPDEAAALPGVIEVVTDKRDLPKLLQRFGLENPPDGIDAFGPRSRVFVKVQDGCNQFCAYCIIPYVRPHLTSRPTGAVLDEIRRLVDSGYQEVVLTGIHLGHYGVDLDEKNNLAGLVRQIARLDGKFRVRISSIEAVEATPELIDVMAEYSEKVCPHLHLSMQSGSDTVLERMRRRFSSSEFLDRCEMIGEKLDRPAFTTDIIVGFPGETNAEFEETLATARQTAFSKIHIFPFSRREGTVAATLPDQIPGNVIRERAARLAELEVELRDAYFRQFLGTRLQVLLESKVHSQSGQLTGTSARYIPVQTDGACNEIGRLVDVQIAPETADTPRPLPHLNAHRDLSARDGTC
ncbi:MAG: tRNA (N(6)-L-threonylcarbamoyladenosine(37)-C(2))-methylthiotransferase MtaB [Planctomycetia bacterium]|jgi:threonylcarbamoyladenosine tRNA methylthiotransferase MtaB